MSEQQKINACTDQSQIIHFGFNQIDSTRFFVNFPIESYIKTGPRWPKRYILQMTILETCKHSLLSNDLVVSDKKKPRPCPNSGHKNTGG